ncbi:MAG: hypothetical protein Q9227_002365 [Pyrenula ochraceoflavens]
MERGVNKRRRERPDVDAELIEIYEDLTNTDEDVRLSATRHLLSKITRADSSVKDTVRNVLTRLFKGLGSGRKAARVGFSVALAEILSILFTTPKISHNITIEDVLEIFKTQTESESRISGQDERDHAFGKLFGASSIIQSHMLLAESASSEDHENLIQFICELASQKTWLREACGSVLLDYLGSTGSAHQKCAEHLLEILASRKTIRTPEGVAIWLQTQSQYPSARLPPKVWKDNDPLLLVNRSLLAEVLRDAQPKTEEENVSNESQGKRVWSPQLHFVWDYVLRAQDCDKSKLSPAASTAMLDRMSFSAFWEESVEHGLFDSSSSAERKHWGMLLLRKVISQYSSAMFTHVFTSNVVSCLVAQLASSERNLHQDAMMVLETLQTRVEREPEAVNPPLKAFLGNTGSLDFDRITKTKAVEDLIKKAPDNTIPELYQFLRSQFLRPDTVDEKGVQQMRQRIVDRLVSIFVLRKASKEAIESLFLEFLISHGYFLPGDPDSNIEEIPTPPITESTRTKLQTTLTVYLDHILKRDLSDGAPRVFAIIQNFRSIELRLQHPVTIIAQFDSAIQQSVDTAWKSFGQLRERATASASNQTSSFSALALLYSLTLLQAYCGETDAIAMLDDLQECHDQIEQTSSRLEGHDLPKYAEAADAMTELTLAYSSKPSKFFRRVAHLVFQSIAPQVSMNGLDSLFRVLQTKENVHGQHELFETENVDVAAGKEAEEGEEEVSDLENASEAEAVSMSAADDNSDNDHEDDDEEEKDKEELDSDVQMLSAPSASDTPSSSTPDTSPIPSDVEDADLAAFDAQLSAALRTKNAPPSSSGSTTPSSMSSSQMAALDTHLSSLFRERLSQSSKKNQTRAARDHVTAFKNRVLDLLEIYLRPSVQQDKSKNKRGGYNGLALECLVPILAGARETRVEQVRERAYTIVGEFVRKARKGGRSGLGLSAEEGMKVLRDVHAEARNGESRRHAELCGRVAALLVKAIVEEAEAEEGAENVLREIQETYKETEKAGVVRQEFFGPWRDWVRGQGSRWGLSVGAVRGREEEGEEKAVDGDGKVGKGKKRKKSQKSEKNRRRKERRKKLKSATAGEESA